MLGTVYIRDINFAFQNSQKVMQIFSVLMVWNIGAFSTDRLRCLLFAFVVFTVGLSTSFLRPRWKAKLKPREIATLPLQEGPTEAYHIYAKIL